MKAWKQKRQSTFNRQIDLFQYYSCLSYESPLIHLAPFMPQQAETRDQMNKYFLIIVWECFFGSKEKSTTEEGRGGGSSCEGKREETLSTFFFPTSPTSEFLDL